MYRILLPLTGLLKVELTMSRQYVQDFASSQTCRTGHVALGTISLESVTMKVVWQTCGYVTWYVAMTCVPPGLC